MLNFDFFFFSLPLSLSLSLPNEGAEKTFFVVQQILCVERRTRNLTSFFFLSLSHSLFLSFSLSLFFPIMVRKRHFCRSAHFVCGKKDAQFDFFFFFSLPLSLSLSLFLSLSLPPIMMVRRKDIHFCRSADGCVYLIRS